VRLVLRKTASKMGDFDLPDLSKDIKAQEAPADAKPVEPKKPAEIQEANFSIPDLSADLKSSDEPKKKKQEDKGVGFDEIPEVASEKTAVAQQELPKKSISELAKTGVDIAKTAVSPFIDAAKGVDYKSAGSQTQKAAEEVKKDWGIAEQQEPIKVEDKSGMVMPNINADIAKEPQTYDPFAVASEQIRKVGPNSFGEPEKDVIKTLAPTQLYDVWQQQPWIWSKLDKEQQDVLFNQYQNATAVTPETAEKAGESFAKSIGGALRAGLDLSLHTLESGITEPIDYFAGKSKYDPDSRTQKNQAQLRKDLTNLSAGLAGTIIQSKRLIEKSGGDPSVVTPIADNYASRMAAEGKQPDGNAYQAIAGLEFAMKSMPYFSVGTKLAEMSQDPNSGSIAVLDKLNKSLGLSDESMERKHFDRRAAYDAEKAESDWRAAGGEPIASPWAQALVSEPSQWIIHQYSRSMLPTAKAYAAAKNISEDEAERILDDQAEKNTQARIDSYAKKLSKDYDPDMEFLGSLALGEGTMGPAGLVLGGARVGKGFLTAAETFGMTKAELAAYQASQAVRNLQRTKEAADRAAKAGFIGKAAGAIEQAQKAIPQKFKDWSETLPPEVQALAPYAGKALEKIALGGAGAEIGATLDPENPIRGALTGLTLGQIAGASPALIRSISDASRYMEGGFGLGRGGLYETAGKLETSSPLTRAVFGGGRGAAIDYVAKNALPIMRSGASLGALNVATSTMNSDDATKMVESGAEGFAMGSAFGLLHGGVGLVGGRNADEIMRDRKKQDIENYLSMQRADPQTRQSLAQIGDYNQRVGYWEQELAKTQADLAEAVNSGDATKITEAQKRVKVTQAIFDQVNKANIQTRSEYGRSIISLFSDLNRLANGARGAGQGRVKIRILDQNDIFNMLRERNAKEGTGLSDEQIMQNAQSAGYFDKLTNEAIINGDRIKARMARGESAHDALVHEGGGHVLFSIPEFREKNRRAEELLFGKKEVDLQGRVLSKEDGQFSDDDLVKMYENYNKDLTPEEIEAQARQTGLWNEQTQSLDPQRVAEYMKEEVVAELVAGNLKNGLLNLKRTTGSLDRWITGRYKQSILARAMHDMLGRGIKPFESKLLGTRDTPLGFSEEAISANREAISALEEFNGRFEDIPDGERGKDMSEKEMRVNPVARKRYAMNGGEYKTQLVGVIKDADGRVVAKVPITNPNAAEGSWKYDEAGNKTQTRGYGQVPDEFTGQAPPAGGTLEVVRDFVFEPDGKTPVRNTDKELADIEKSRGDAIREALESADDYDSPHRLRPFSADGLSWSGKMSPKQIENIKNLPESVLPLSIKEKILHFNEMLTLEDGSTADIDYAPRLGKSRKYKGRRSEIYHIIPVGFGFSKEGNFYLRTISLNALFRKVRARKERMKGWFDPWNGDTELFMKELQEKYLPNTKEGRAGWTGLDPDRPTEKTPLAETKMNRFNDMLNLMKAGVERINPEAMATPKKKGARKAEDVDTLWRSHRLDAIADIADTTEVTGTYPVGWERVYRNMMPAGRVEETAPRVEEERKPQAINLGITAAHSTQNRPFSAQYVAPQAQAQAAPKSDLFFMPASAEIREKGSKQQLEFFDRVLENSGIKAKPATMDALDQFIHQHVQDKYSLYTTNFRDQKKDAQLFPTPNAEKIKSYYEKVVRNATPAQAVNFPENWRRVRKMSDQEFNDFFSQDRVNEITQKRVNTLAKSANYLLGEMQNPRLKELKEARDEIIKAQQLNKDGKSAEAKELRESIRKKYNASMYDLLEEIGHKDLEQAIGSYTPAEVAAILDQQAKVRIKAATNEDGELQIVKQNLTDGNEAMPNEVSGATASRITEYMRQGMSSKDAYAKGVFDEIQARAKQRGTFTGWKKYDQSDDIAEAEKLNADLVGTNWCTGGSVGTANDHLRGGDFYVYYDEGDPQVAIRTNDGQIAEVRGRGDAQNITTPKYDEIAENFIRSEEGLKGGESYLYDRDFRKMAVQVMETGKVPEEAYKYYNQLGIFIPPRARMERGDFDQEYIAPFRDHAPTQADIFDEKTGVLKTSYDYSSRDPNREKYRVINGDIKTALPFFGDATFDMPNLEKCGNIDAASYGSIFLPKLKKSGFLNFKRVEGDIELRSLETAGDILVNKYGSDLNLPQLKSCADLIAGNARKIYAPNLEVCRNIDFTRKGEIYLKELTLPKLEKAERILADYTNSVVLPKLKECTNLFAVDSGYLYAPELEKVDSINGALTTIIPKLNSWGRIKADRAKEVVAPMEALLAFDIRNDYSGGMVRFVNSDNGRIYDFDALSKPQFVWADVTPNELPSAIKEDTLKSSYPEGTKVSAATFETGHPRNELVYETGKSHEEIMPFPLSDIEGAEKRKFNRIEREGWRYGFEIVLPNGAKKSVSRREAFKVAKASGQLREPKTEAEKIDMLRGVLHSDMVNYEGEKKPDISFMPKSEARDEEPIQKISSAGTSLRQVPAVFKAIPWKKGTLNADIGGGKYDEFTNALQGVGVENVIYDPYNRSKEFNQAAMERIAGNADTATISNVLNVIAEPAARDQVIRQAADAIKPDGEAYFSVYDGDKSGKGKETPRGYQLNRKLSDYIDEIEKHFGSVTKKGNILIAKEPKKSDIRFMPAAKIDEAHADLERRYKEGDEKAWGDAINLVHDKAEKAGLRIGYHGSPNEDLRNHVFDMEDASYRGGLLAFASDEPSFAEKYGKGGRVYELYVDMQNPVTYKNKKQINRIAENFYDETGGITDSDDVYRILIGKGYTEKQVQDEIAKGRTITEEEFKDSLNNGNWDAFESNQFVEWAWNNGHDGMIMRENGSDTYGVYNPQQLKLADPFTYDNEGNLIPLSQRFDTSKQDIRFMPKSDEAKGIDWNGLKFAADAFAKAPEKPLAGLAMPKTKIPDLAFAPKQNQDEGYDFIHEAGQKLPSKVPARGHFRIGVPTPDGRILVYKLDPKRVVMPEIKGLDTISGEYVHILQADRHDTIGDNMGGPMHPYLISNQVTAIGPDGIEYKPVWANMTAGLVTRAKNRVMQTQNGYTIVYAMDQDAHKSNRKLVSDYMKQVDDLKNAGGLTAEQIGATHVLLELGKWQDDRTEAQLKYRKAKELAEQNGTKPPKPLKDTPTDKAIMRLNAELSPLKSHMTSGKPERIAKAQSQTIKILEKYSKQDWYKELAKKTANMSFANEMKSFSFTARALAMDKIAGVPFLPSLNELLRNTEDFKNAENSDIVGVVQLSKNRDVFAIYLGKDPKQEAKMSKSERAIRDQFLKDPRFKIHPSYDWMMLGPANGNNFIVASPRKLREVFPKYEKQHAKLKLKPKEKITDALVAGSMNLSAEPKIKIP
jgi:hypothetical protein